MSAPADADASLAQSDIPLDASAGSAGGASAAAASSSSSAAAAALPPPPPPLLAEDAAARALYVPITYGNISTCLGKKQGSGETMFKWTCYVRSPDGVDGETIPNLGKQRFVREGVAEREGFEPSMGLPPNRISNAAP